MAPGILLDDSTSTANGSPTEIDAPREADVELPKLRSSGGPIDPDSVGYLTPSFPTTPIEELREQFKRQGYLWLKGVIPKEDVWAMREKYFDYLPGLTKKGTPTRDGIFCGEDWRLWMQPGKLRGKFGFENKNTEYVQRMVNAHKEPWYREFCDHPAVHNFIVKFTGWNEAVLLERSILRPNVPGGQTTQVHYDQIFLRAGPPTSITAWTPIGDCAINGGGLLYLEDSVPIGKELERGFNEAAKDLSEAERISAFNCTMMDTGYLEKDSGKFSAKWGKKWLAANYEAGDVVLHDPHMIHCAALNQDLNGVIRLATDLRFVEAGKAYDTRWMKIWTPGDGL